MATPQDNAINRGNDRNFRALWIVSCGVLLAARIVPVPQHGTLLGLPTLCPFKALTGCPCPGCGMTRALVLCGHGDWAQAFAFHPLAPLVYGALWCILIGGVLGAWRTGSCGAARVLTSRAALPVAEVAFATMMLIWVLRLSNVVPFPPNF
jgi:hypothetical protein